MAVNRVHVTIDRVRLHGVAKDDVPALIAAMQRALEHSLADQVEPRTWKPLDVNGIRADSVRARRGPRATGHAFGQAMAAALNGRLMT
jgi:hypothetical protein